MKTRLLLFFVPLLTLAPALWAAPPHILSPAAHEGPVKPVRIIGLSRGDTWSMLGDPSARLTRDVWIYFDYKSSVAEDNRRGLDTLVIVFIADRVSGVK